ncbi:MAG: histidine phosphatase family protein [Bacteroidetes bacterium]|nr:histidine phosphatase family protein [Bacteroidota bacterium]
MKKLYLIRHAKSSWDNNVEDFYRPLNERGMRDAPKMAELLKQRAVSPNRILTSPAVRALTTANIFATVLGFAPHQIETVAELYHASKATWLQVLRSLKDSSANDTIFIFGHNPGITDLTNVLLRTDIDFPTCGVVSATLKIKSWSETTSNCGELNFFDYPKQGF